MKIEELKEERIDLFKEFLLNEQNQLDEDYYEEHYAVYGRTHWCRGLRDLGGGQYGYSYHV